MTPHVLAPRTYVTVFGALLFLLLVTVAAAALDLGPMNFVVAMAIAAVKATLIVLVFMHVRYGSRLTWVFAGAAFLWLGILLALSLSDYLTRGILNIPGK
jgi:cytochrome c oxidase subunit 4